MITATLTKTQTDLNGKPIKGMAEGDLVRIVEVNDKSILVERPNDLETFIVMEGEIIVFINHEVVVDFTKRLITLVKALEALSTYKVISGMLPGLLDVGEDEVEAAFTLDLLRFVDSLGQVTRVSESA